MARVKLEVEFTEKHDPQWASIDRLFNIPDKKAYHVYKKLEKFQLFEQTKPQEIDKKE